MRNVLVAGYLAIGFLSAMWQDAMDSRYGLNGQKPVKGWASTTFAGLAWPVALPLVCGMMLTEDGGRWRLAAR